MGQGRCHKTLLIPTSSISKVQRGELLCSQAHGADQEGHYHQDREITGYETNSRESLGKYMISVDEMF